MIANKLAFAVLALVVLLAIAFYAVYRKTGTVTVGAVDIYLCLHNLKYIILLRLSPFFYYSSILFDTPPIYFIHPVQDLLIWHTLRFHYLSNDQQKSVISSPYLATELFFGLKFLYVSVLIF